MVENIFKEQVKVPAQMGYLRVLRKFVNRIGKKYGFSQSELYAFKSCVDEACSNIIEHGYGFEDGSITIKAIVDNNCFTIELIDNGKEFDPKNVDDPDLQKYIEDRKKGGLGIFIMKKLLDEICYQRTAEGNILKLVKFRQNINNQEKNSSTSLLFKRVKDFFLQ